MDSNTCTASDLDEPEARWANRFKTGYRPCVIELVFFQKAGKNDRERILTRIIASPDDAKDFMVTLQGTIEKYEEKYGTIREKDCSGPNNDHE